MANKPARSTINGLNKFMKKNDLSLREAGILVDINFAVLSAVRAGKPGSISREAEDRLRRNLNMRPLRSDKVFFRPCLDKKYRYLTARQIEAAIIEKYGEADDEG